MLLNWTGDADQPAAAGAVPEPLPEPLPGSISALAGSSGLDPWLGARSG